MRTTQRKGDIAKAQAVATFTRLGFDVSMLLTESAAYDLIVDDGDNLWRVQVKFIGGSYVDLRRIHSNSQGYVVKKTVAKSYDWLYVLKADGSEYVIKRCLTGSAYTPRETDKITESWPNGKAPALNPGEA